MRYLDPKNDLTFKKIFGQHPDILIDFLNAILPLPDDKPIVSIEYLSAEQVPIVPLFKNSIVDVKCKDKRGRVFIVEMQLLWTDSFASRVVFNASKAYVAQLYHSEEYKKLEPVYALSLVDEEYTTTQDYLHHYKIVNVGDQHTVLEGLEFVFVELPHIRAENLPKDIRKRAWLRFFTEIRNHSEAISKEIIANPATQQAVELLQESAFTEQELEYYDKYWDTVRVERTIRGDAREEGHAEGMKIGIEKGIEKGREEGREEGMEKVRSVAIHLKERGFSVQDISAMTGLSKEEIEKLQR
jgi:predicted transposase/invertase (TIGR01784 family)